MEEIRGRWEYVYEILDGKECIYVGRTFDVIERLKSHKKSFQNKDLKIKILEKYEDLEHKWILQKLEQGVVLENIQKNISKEVVEFEIGDVITYTSPLDKVSKYDIYDTTQKELLEKELTKEQVESRFGKLDRDKKWTFIWNNRCKVWVYKVPMKRRHYSVMKTNLRSPK